MQTLRGIFPKPQAPPKHDFIRENVRNIKLMQQRKQSAFQSSTIKIEENKLRNSNLRKSRSSSNTRIANRSSANAVKNSISSKSVENVSDIDYTRKARPLSVQSRDACSQTETVDGELFLKDVIIRLPSAVVLNSNQKNSNGELKNGDKVNEIAQETSFNNFLQHETRFETEKSNETDDVDRARMSPWKNGHDLHNDEEMLANDLTIETDIARPIHQFSARCQQSLAVCANKDNNKTAIPPSYRVGELPNYLKEMKIKEAEKNRLESLIDVNCPPGHIVLSEEDRMDALNIAKKKYQDLINDLNRLPMTSQTLRVRNRQIEIEKELRQLDETLQIFSRSKVYVRID